MIALTSQDGRRALDTHIDGNSLCITVYEAPVKGLPRTATFELDTESAQQLAQAILEWLDGGVTNER